MMIDNDDDKKPDRFLVIAVWIHDAGTGISASTLATSSATLTPSTRKSTFCRIRLQRQCGQNLTRLADNILSSLNTVCKLQRLVIYLIPYLDFVSISCGCKF